MHRILRLSSIFFVLSLLTFSLGQPQVRAADYLSEVNRALDRYDSQPGMSEPSARTVRSNIKPSLPPGRLTDTATPRPVPSSGKNRTTDDDAVSADDTLSEGGSAPTISDVPALPQDEDLPDDMVVDVLELKNMDILDVLNLLSKRMGINIVAGKDIRGEVTIYLAKVKLKDALRIILDANALAYKVEDGVVRIMSAGEYEQRYGEKFGSNMTTKIVRLNHVNALDIFGMLEQIRSPNGKVIVDAATQTLVLMDAPKKIAVMSGLIKKVDVPVRTEVFTLNYARAPDIAERLQQSLSPNIGDLKVDPRSNTIIIKDTPAKIGEFRKIILAFDTRQQQVLIEAKIVQVVLSDQYKFGVDWEGIVAKNHDLTFTGNFDVLSDGSKKGSVSIGTLANDDYTALIEALETIGLTNILSSPSITSLNNEEAKILVGSTEPYVTTTTTTPASGPAVTAENVNFIDVGVKLFVTPTIHEDGFITMKIRPEVSSVTRTLTTSNNNVIPVVETSEAETIVTVKNGVTIIIGGLIKDEKINTDNKVPLLGSIPIVGAAFRNSDHLVRKTETVIFLKPQIISGATTTDYNPSANIPAFEKEALYEPMEY